MRLFQAALHTPFFASLSVHGLHFTVYVPSSIRFESLISKIRVGGHGCRTFQQSSWDIPGMKFVFPGYELFDPHPVVRCHNLGPFSGTEWASFRPLLYGATKNPTDRLYCDRSYVTGMSLSCSVPQLRCLKHSKLREMRVWSLLAPAQVLVVQTPWLVKQIGSLYMLSAVWREAADTATKCSGRCALEVIFACRKESSLPFLAFLEFLASFSCKEFLAFLSFFPSFPRILGVRLAGKILVFSVVFLAFCRKSKERKIREGVKLPQTFCTSQKFSRLCQKLGREKGTWT